ncbi:MAG: hypothetical protein ACI97B_003314, partial [Verrucomicrobiales bacterium]
MEGTLDDSASDFGHAAIGGELPKRKIMPPGFASNLIADEGLQGISLHTC